MSLAFSGERLKGSRVSAVQPHPKCPGTSPCNLTLVLFDHLTLNLQKIKIERERERKKKFVYLKDDTKDKNIELTY